MSGFARWVIWLGLGAVVANATEPRPAAPPAENDHAAEVRRIYAPADRMPQWPMGEQRYLPVEAERFERLLQQAAAAASGHPASDAVRIVQAEYAAQFEGRQLVSGEALWEIARRGEAAVLLPLYTCNLALGEARWLAPDAPAVLGLTADGKPALWVDRAGKARCGWSLRGQPDDVGGVHFTMELPPCATNRLRLDLPSGYRVSTESGVAVRESAASGARQPWRLELGGHSRVRLDITPEAADADRRTWPEVRQTAVYEFSMHGAEANVQLAVDVRAGPLTRLAVDLDPGLRLVSAHYGNQDLLWSVVEGGPEKGARVVLQLPEALRGSGHIIRLTAVAPLVLQESWRLPRVQARNVFWQQGVTTLLVPFPLSIDKLTPSGCRQTGTEPLPGQPNGEAARFESFVPDAAIELVLVRREPRVQTTTGTVVDLIGGEVHAQMIAQFRVAEGEAFSLTADVGRQWIVDALEAAPPDALDDWTIEALESKSKGDVRNRLRVLLAKAIAPTRPLRLKISARRLYAAVGRKLSADDLTPVRFQTPGEIRRLVAVQTAAPYVLKLTGEEQLRRFDLKGLDARDRELFAAEPRGLLFVDDSQAAGLRIALEQRRGGYAAALRVEVTQAGTLLQEAYRLHCVPEAGKVDRLLVHFSHRRDAPLRWSLGGSAETPAMVRRLSAEEQGTAAVLAAPPDEDVWEVTLPHPQSEPFDVRAVRSLPLGKSLPISLVSLPEATQQQGLVLVGALAGLGVQLRTTQLKPAAPGEVTGWGGPPPMAVYRYDPSRDVAGNADAALTVVPATGPLVPAAWAWSSQLQSRIQADGPGLHLAIFRLQNGGRERVELRLPVGRQAELRDVWLNGRPVKGETVAPEHAADRFWITLPADTPFVSLVLQFTTRDAALRLQGTLAAPVVELDVPILAQSWTVWLPPRFKIHGSPAECAADAPGLVQRWLGPLGRGPAAQPWSPLRAEGWLWDASRQAARAAARQRAVGWLEHIGTLVRTSPAGQAGPWKWGPLLAHSTLSSAAPALRADRPALVALGVNPTTAIQPPAGDAPLMIAENLLRQENLALVCHAEELLITTQTRAAMMAAELQALDLPLVYWAESGRLPRRLQASGSAEEFPAAGAWAQDPAAAVSPWTAVRLEGYQPADAEHWNAYEVLYSGGQSLEIRYAQASQLQLWSVITLLAAAAVGLWMLPRWPRAAFWSAAGCALAAAVAPESWLPFCSGAVAGMVLAAVARALLVRQPGPVSADQDVTIARKVEVPSTLSGAQVVGLVLCALALAWGRAWPARGEQTPAAKPTPHYDVFFPVDERQQPTDGKVYVPEELYQRLAREVSDSVQPQSWLLTDAVYRAALDWQAAPERLVVSAFKAQFTVQVFHPGTRIRIPLMRDRVHLIPEDTLLDGRPAQPVWDPGGAALLIDVAESGPCRLDLSLRPTLKTSGAQSSFELPVPPLARARLEIVTPAGAPKIEVPSALGSVHREEDQSRVVAELGPTARLAVAWDASARRSGGHTEVDVEEFLWLKIQPNAVLLDAQFQYKVVEGRLYELQLAADSRLRMLPLGAANPAVNEVRTTPGEPQLLRLELTRPVVDQTVLNASFRLADTTPAGNLRLPHLESIGARRTKRWLAVSIDPSLNHQEQLAEPLPVLPVSEFLGEWGSADARPQLAYRLPLGPTPWSIALHPRPTQVTADNVLAISFSQNSAELQFDAQLAASGGACFQQRLKVPPTLEILRLSVREDKTERAGRWALDSKGELLVFFNNPVTGKHRLQLHGRMGVAIRSPVTLPQVLMPQCTVQSSRIEIFRQPSVLLKPTKVTGLTEIETPAGEPYRNELGRLVTSFKVDPARAGRATLQLQLNQLKATATELIVMRGDENAWTATLEVRVDEVRQGALDLLQIEVPPGWNGPYKLDPPEPFDDLPGEPRRLIVHPASVVQGSYRLRISSPVAVSPAQPVSVPLIRLRWPEPTRRLVALPWANGKQPLVWDVPGLQPAQMPAKALAALGLEAPRVFQARNQPFRAVLRPQVAGTGSAEVALAELALGCEGPGRFRALATYHLNPGRRSECTLVMPPDTTLVHVSIAGVPVAAERKRENYWRIPLAYGPVPQPVDVLFTGRFDALTAGEPRALPLPSLDGTQVQQTLLTIRDTDGHASHLLQGAAEAPATTAMLLSMRALVADLEHLPAAVALSREDLGDWYRSIAGRLSVARADLEQAATSGGAGLPPTVRAELQALETRQARAAQKIISQGVAITRAGLPPIAPGAPDLWRDTFATASTKQYVFEGKGEDQRLVCCDAPSLKWGVGAYFVLAVVSILLVRLALAWDLFARVAEAAPHAAMIGLGLIWWFWLWPSVLGLFLAGCGLVDWGLRRLRTARQPVSPSAISMRNALR